MAHPYERFEGTPMWHALDASVRELERNRDLQLGTARAYVIGHLCVALSGPNALFPAAKELRDYMSALSEAAWSAGWMANLEYELWSALNDGRPSYGRLRLDEPILQRLRELSSRCGGWIAVDEAAGGEVFVPRSEWVQRVELFRTGSGPA